MWNGLVSDELNEFFQLYSDRFDGTEPDEYEDVNYEDMDHDEFIHYIRISLETGKELPDVIGE